ncbi:phosphotransferase family protein [Qipengyuania sp. RANM35]|uniref:phosphotransferase family protein n=1 Tax=Qipengyuania sp. RANM35 TaxID=3068635 RepID=UPI0034DAD010
MGVEERGAAIESGLERALARVGIERPSGLTRLTGGATMESWRFSAGGEDFVLRRAPSAAMMEGRAIGHDIEAAAIRAVHAVGVLAPEIVVELEEADGLGTGFVMRALPGTPDPRTILGDNSGEAEGRLLGGQLARELAGIHNIDPGSLPTGLPTLDPAEGVAGLRTQYEEAGGNRPIVALALRWLVDNLPGPTEPALIHGDYRLGNVLVAGTELTGVLDWELAHLGDPHEDLAYACLTVWRFARIDRPAAGLASLDDWFAAYESAGGRRVDRARFHWWLVYRTCWWALGCWRMGRTWREGADRTVERAIISRRTSEQELDLLLLLEGEAPEEERTKSLPASSSPPPPTGEATAGELATAISEWLATVKDRMEGHDRFQHAVARNALGIIARDYAAQVIATDAQLARALLEGERTLAEPGLLARLRRTTLDKLAVDMPKYPALAVARRKWTGED